MSLKSIKKHRFYDKIKDVQKVWSELLKMNLTSDLMRVEFFKKKTILSNFQKVLVKYFQFLYITLLLNAFFL